MTSLARDRRGNTLAIVAASVIPLAGLVGGGVDISRMYIVKTRLQHACDAGTLAGRKQMGGGTWAYNDYEARDAANRFFDANIQENAYGATSLTRSFSESAGKVTGTASATVPTTIMRVFGKNEETLSVTCDAEMRLPNTDVMFVLDITGSMNYCPNGSSSCNGNANSRIAALRIAVKCFYQIVARRDVTDADCEGDEPSGGTGDQVQIRFGFVPYSTNVNVGKLLPTNFFADSWSYQTRRDTGRRDWGSWAEYRRYNVNWRDSCAPAPDNTPTQQYQGEKRNDWRGYYCVYETRTMGPVWQYGRLPVNVGLLKDGTDWRDSFEWPIANDGANRTIPWDGCIEERQTARTTNFNPIPTGAKDLNIDLVPEAGDPTTQWGPALPRLIYTPQGSGSGSWTYTGTTDDGNPEIDSTDNYPNSPSYACTTEARTLQVWDDPALFQGYVNSLTPSGNTYHDIGMLWGARLMSPTGIFAADNALTPGGGEIERHMIFMTDGDTNAQPSDYAAYGLPWFDRRQTDASSSPSKTQLDNQVNLRFLALCNAVKNKNITLWVINFGEGQSAATLARLETCASSGRYFSALNAAALQTTFKNIANQISQLRLTK